MRLLLIALLALQLIGCKGYAGPPIIEPELTYSGAPEFSHIRDQVLLKPSEWPGIKNVSLTTTNRMSHEVVRQSIADSEAGAIALRIDPAHLPGLKPHGSMFQTFDLTIQVMADAGPSTVTERLTVVLDKEALPPAAELHQLPLASGPEGLPAAPTNDFAELASSIVASYEGRHDCVTSRIGTLAELNLPPESRDAFTNGARLREYTVHGAFPKRIVRKPWSAGDEQLAVVTPKGLRFVIAETVPSQVINLEILTEDLTASPTAAPCKTGFEGD